MLHLTVQFVVPVGVIQPEHPKAREMKTITRPRVVFSEPDTESIPNLASLLPSPVHTDDLVFVLPFQPSPGRLPPEVPLSKRQKLFFPPLKPTSTLAEVLRGTAWVEFPTFHIVPRTEWEDGKRKGEIVVVPLNEPVLDEPGASGRLRDSGWGAKRKATVEMPVRLEKKAKMMPDLRLAALEEYESASDDEGPEKEDGEIHEPVGIIVTGTGSIRSDDEP